LTELILPESEKMLRVAEAGLLLENNFFLSKLRQIEKFCYDFHTNQSGQSQASQADQELIAYVLETLYSEDDPV
jgi:hypothetical protein